MNIERITCLEDGRVDDVIKLYIDSFAESERKDIEKLKWLIVNEPRMNLCSVMIENKFSGFIIYWILDGFYYWEYFTILSNIRNQNIGKKVLDWVKNNLEGVIILEVEEPLDDIKSRRIKYYERNGYVIVDKTYRQPCYKTLGVDYPLWIMSNQQTENTEKYTDLIKKHVYTL